MLFPFANIQCYGFCWTPIWRFCLSRLVSSFCIFLTCFWQLYNWFATSFDQNFGVQRSIVNPNFALGLLIHWGPHCLHDISNLRPVEASDACGHTGTTQRCCCVRAGHRGYGALAAASSCRVGLEVICLACFLGSFCTFFLYWLCCLLMNF